MTDRIAIEDFNAFHTPKEGEDMSPFEKMHAALGYGYSINMDPKALIDQGLITDDPVEKDHSLLQRFARNAMRANNALDTRARRPLPSKDNIAHGFSGLYHVLLPGHPDAQKLRLQIQEVFDNFKLGEIWSVERLTRQKNWEFPSHLERGSR